MNLFIDTNVYLTFYHFTSDDLEELNKLIVAIDNKNINLIITDQVIDEFNRNREAKIFDALKRFNDQKLNNQFPQICKGYQEFTEIKESIKRYSENKEKILGKLTEDIENKTLQADIIINTLFSKAKKFETTDEVFRLAKKRFDLGNPPGKKDSYGDAINWILLLKSTLSIQELNFISDDKDFISPLNENKMLRFLVDEWEKRSAESKINFYRKLSEFFLDKFPDIKLASELEKELAISNFINSTNFTATHLAISKLRKYSDFSEAEVNTMIKASTENSQIYLIQGDKDVTSFLADLIKNNGQVVDKELMKAFDLVYCDNSANEEDMSPPF